MVVLGEGIGATLNTSPKPWLTTAVSAVGGALLVAVSPTLFVFKARQTMFPTYVR